MSAPLTISASKLHEYLGADCGESTQLYRLRQSLSAKAKREAARYQSNRQWFTSHPYKVPRYASQHSRNQLWRFGVQGMFPALLKTAEAAQTREDLHAIPSLCRKRFFSKDNIKLNEGLQAAQTRVRAAYNSDLSQQVGDRVRELIDPKMDIEPCTKWLHEMEQAAPVYGKISIGELGLLRQYIGALRSLLIHLGGLEAHIQREARRAYGKASEVICRTNWNDYFEQELRKSNQMLQKAILSEPPSAVVAVPQQEKNNPRKRCRVELAEEKEPTHSLALRGLTDGCFADGTLVEFKFRVDRLRTRGQVPRMSELLQVHAYMFMQDKARSVLVEGLHTRKLMLLREHEIAFDTLLWREVISSLGRFRDFRNKLESDALFRMAFFALAEDVQCQMLHDYVNFRPCKKTVGVESESSKCRSLKQS